MFAYLELRLKTDVWAYQNWDSVSFGIFVIRFSKSKTFHEFPLDECISKINALWINWIMNFHFFSFSVCRQIKPEISKFSAFSVYLLYSINVLLFLFLFCRQNTINRKNCSIFYQFLLNAMYNIEKHRVYSVWLAMYRKTTQKGLTNKQKNRKHLLKLKGVLPL